MEEQTYGIYVNTTMGFEYSPGMVAHAEDIDMQEKTMLFHRLNDSAVYSCEIFEYANMI